MIAEFGGAEGPCERSLMKSALARPRQIFAYSSSPDLHELAAAYIVDLVRDPPFVDGNKRTGFRVGILFLELNGYRLTASEEAAAQADIDLAAGQLDEVGLIAFLRENRVPSESSQCR